jgi:hypothetical protein
MAKAVRGHKHRQHASNHGGLTNENPLASVIAAAAWGDSRDFQFADLHRLLRDRAVPAPAATGVVGEEVQPADCELPVLRSVESAVRDPAVVVDDGRLVGGAADPRERHPGPSARLADVVADRQPRLARLLQVRRLPAAELGRADERVRHRMAGASVGHHPAGRHLVLYLPDPVLHARRLPAPGQAGHLAARLLAVRHLLPAAGRRADRAPHRSDAAVRHAAQRDCAADDLGPDADDSGTVREDRAGRRPAGAGGGCGLRQQPGAADAGRLVRDHRLLRANLLRFRRLHHHGDRLLAGAGILADRQLPLPLRGARLSPTSGGAGTSRCRPGCATTSTCRSAATARARGAPTST